jgi:flavin-dependent dehydrogenase
VSVTHWDAIVVGAGPAGSALACRLRPHRRVLLLERGAIGGVDTPRIGESLPGAARVLLQRIGVYERFLADGHAERGATVSAWDRDEPVWFDPLRDPNGLGWHLDRARFDARLRDAAVTAGATLVDRCERLQVSRIMDDWCVDLPSRGEVHRAPVLVDASGRSAAVARRLGLSHRVDDTLICLYAHLPADTGDEDACTRLCVDRNGWWYSVRLPSGQRVLAFHLDADDPELKTLRDPERLLAKARLQPLLVDALANVPVNAGGARLRREAVQVHARPAGSAVLDGIAATPPGFFAIGDAMLSFDPVASQGIFNALATAESAAGAIERQLDHPEHAASAREPFLAEMHAVHARYRAHLHATYAGVARHRREPFWSRRIDG